MNEEGYEINIAVTPCSECGISMNITNAWTEGNQGIIEASCPECGKVILIKATVVDSQDFIESTCPECGKVTLISEDELCRARNLDIRCSECGKTFAVKRKLGEW